MGAEATYGWRAVDIEDVAARLQEALPVELQGRHSLYWGDHYGWDGTPRGELLLQENFFDEIDQELAVPEHPEHGVILHASFLPPAWGPVILGVAGAELLASGPPAEPVPRM